jgi:hypothetical protein
MKAIQTALNRAYAKLAEAGLSLLADHLKKSIERNCKTFTYRPVPAITWSFDYPTAL